MHFPLCRGIQCPSASKPLDYAVFNRVSRRYAALRSGVPRQELRIPIGMPRSSKYVWSFSENLLVLDSSRYSRVALTLIYLDARNESRRIINGEVVLDADAMAVSGVKVCHLVLVLSLISSLLTTLSTVRYAATYFS